MAYRLVVLNDLADGSGGSMGIIDGIDVSPRDYERYLAADRGVRELMVGGLWAYAKQALTNYDHFLSAVANTIDEIGFAKAEVFRRPAMQTAGANASLSFASAVHLFQEQTLAAARRASGTKAQATAERLFSEVYDENVEHFLVYRLRNLLIHYSMACVRVELSDPDQEAEGRGHRVVLDREVVLKAPKGVNRAIRDYLEHQPEDPDLSELFESTMSSVLGVFRQARPLTHPDADWHLETLRHLGRLFGMATGTRAVAQLPDNYDVTRIETVVNLILDEIFAFAESDGAAGASETTPPSSTPSFKLGITSTRRV